MNNAQFNDLEGLRIAVEMERRGGEFYRHAARLSNSPKAVSLLSELAAEEEEHRAEFQRLYDQALTRHSEETEELYEGEAAAYLSAVAADVVFPGGLMDLGRQGGFESPTAILISAMQSEKDSILFYTEMIAQARDPQARTAFSQILLQERHHLSRLQDQLLALN